MAERIRLVYNGVDTERFSPEHCGRHRAGVRRRVRPNLATAMQARFDAALAARDFGACALVKGLRAISDFDYEFQMAQINKQLAPDIETVYFPASAKFSFISSSGVKEIAVWGGNVEEWVPANVVDAFSRRATTEKE